MATDGRKIRETRKLLGLKQQELAMQLGVSQGTVSRWEKNQQKPDFETMLKLAEMAGLPNPVAFARDHDEHQLDTMRLSRAFTVVGAIDRSRRVESPLWEERERRLISFPIPEDWTNYHLASFIIDDYSADKLYPPGTFILSADFDLNGLKPQEGDLVVFADRGADGLYSVSLRHFRRPSSGRGGVLSTPSTEPLPDVSIPSLMPADIVKAGGYAAMGFVGLVVGVFILTGAHRLPPGGPTE